MKQYQIDLYNQYHSSSIDEEKFSIAREIIRSKKFDKIIHYCLMPNIDLFEGERWANTKIKGIENLFLFSNFGRCKRLFRYVLGYRNGTPKRWEEKIVIPSRMGEKRLRFKIEVNGIKNTLFPHQAVMRTFFLNPFNYPAINHIDGDQYNNHFLNLEYCSDSYNERHSFKVLGKKLVAKKLSQSHLSKGTVGQYSLDGELIRTFECISETANYGFIHQHVSAVTRGKRLTHAGSIWKLINIENE